MPKPLWGKQGVCEDNAFDGLRVALAPPSLALPKSSLRDSHNACLQRELSFFSCWENPSTLTFQLKIPFHVHHVTKRLLWPFSHPSSAQMTGWMTVKWGRTESTLNSPTGSQSLGRRDTAYAPALCVPRPPGPVPVGVGRADAQANSGSLVLFAYRPWGCRLESENPIYTASLHGNRKVHRKDIP